MLSELIRRLLAAGGVVFRTIRAFFSRQIQTIVARIRNATSLTRQASKAAPALLKKVTDVGKKPSKREDYIETQQVFIAKSLIFTVILAIVVAGALFYFLAWPWLLSHFFTAKFWSQDPKTEDYSGKVILYYEKEKDTVQFRGRLTEGVIQGPGESYNENGLLVYSGDFVDGVYEGAGKLYDAGNLVYDGTFAQGVYDGQGKLYEDGSLVYAGAFVQGVYEGAGKLYDGGELLYAGTFAQGLYDGEGSLYDTSDGKPLYEGGFSAGLRSGEGTAYENGERLYKGEFAGDLYNGEGVLYDPKLGVRYRGQFLDGLYSGEGVLTLDSGATVQAAFEQGQVIGDAKCFLDGKLYYEGSLRQQVPDGMGTLYSASGEALYTGPMRYGLIDGAALLGMPAADLRALLTKTTEQTYDRGFTIECQALGFAAFCSYALEDADPTVYQVYLYAPEASRPLASLLWDGPEGFEALARQDEVRPERAEGGAAAPAFPFPLPVDLGEQAYCQPYTYEDGYVLDLWSRGEGQALSLVAWGLSGEMPEPEPDGEEPSGSAAAMDALIDRLGLVSDRLTGDGGADPGGDPADDPNSGAALLQAVAEDESVYPVLQAALRYLGFQELRTAAQEDMDLYKAMAQAEQELLDAGKGDAERMAAWEDAAAQLDVQITNYTAQMRKEARNIENATGLQAADYHLEDLLVFFEVGELDMDALGDAVIATAEAAAQAEAGEDPAAGEPPAVDRRALLEALEDDILDLELAHQQVQLALRNYDSALERLAELEDQNAVGKVEKTDVQTAQIAANERRGLLYEAMSAFAQRAAELDESTGGALARSQAWLPDILAK